MGGDIFAFIVSVSFMLLVFVLFYVALLIQNKKANRFGGIQIGGSQYIDYRLIEKRYREGLKGERKVFAFLKSIIRKDEYLLTNLTLPNKDDVDAEVDCILISRKGIFCIEIKNWVGIVRGSEIDPYWTQARLDRRNIFEKRHNPVKQNEWHCDMVEELLGYKYAVDNIIIFPALKDLKMIISKHTFLLKDFQYCYETLEDNQLSLNEVRDVCNKLSDYVNKSYEMFAESKSLTSFPLIFL